MTAVAPSDGRGGSTETCKEKSTTRTAGASDAGVTEAFPSEYAARLEGIEAQSAAYYTPLDHPQAKTLKCQRFPRRRRAARTASSPVGYTHAADGTRLLDVFGRALSGDFVDDNQIVLGPKRRERGASSSVSPPRGLLYYEKHCKYV